MGRSLTPAALLDEQASLFRTQLNGVYDGLEDAVHDARIATRRIRELLALVPVIPGRDGDADVASSYREIGRALGKVRDIDVRIALIKELETHAPQTAPSLVVVRQEHERDRLYRMRRLIKTLERVDVDALLGTTSARNPAGVRSRLSRTWHDQLRHLLTERARTAAERIAHATGVYFPNRVHSARIALKQLRYAAEMGQVTGLAEMREPLKRLRRGQEILGDLHDRQTLSETLADCAQREDMQTEHLRLSSQVLDGEVLERHAQYLTRRDDLRRACDDIERLAAPTSQHAPAIAVGSAILASGLAYLSIRSHAR